MSHLKVHLVGVNSPTFFEWKIRQGWPRDLSLSTQFGLNPPRMEWKVDASERCLESFLDGVTVVTWPLDVPAAVIAGSVSDDDFLLSFSEDSLLATNAIMRASDALVHVFFGTEDKAIERFCGFLKKRRMEWERQKVPSLMTFRMAEARLKSAAMKMAEV